MEGHKEEAFSLQRRNLLRQSHLDKVDIAL